MATDTTPLHPWQQLGDPDYMSAKILTWATLLGRAGLALEEHDQELRDHPGVEVGPLHEAMQLVALVEEEIRPFSVFLKD